MTDNNDTNEILLPLLYKAGKRGELRYFEVRIVGTTFYTRAGVLKNRLNHLWKSHKRDASYAPDHGAHRSAEQVAYEHAQSKWGEKKRNDAMTEDLEEITNPERRKYQIPIAPVLATRYDKLQERHSKYQACVQSGRKPACTMYQFPDREYYWEYKFDGERGTVSWCQELKPIYNDNQDIVGHEASGEPGVHVFSRARVEIPHLEQQKAVFQKIYTAFGKSNPQIYNWHFDCEIMLPENCRNKMRSVVSRIKEKHEDNDKIVLYVFDIITTYGMPYKERRNILEMIFSKVKSKYVQLVPTIGKAKLGDPIIDEYCSQAFSMGFEGVVGKDEDFIYPLSNLRIDELVKYKVEHDREYRIIGCSQGTDAHAGLIVLQVEDLNDGLIKFFVTPCWTHQDRKEAFELYQQDPSHFVGKLVTVVYKYLNSYSVPEEARATRLRDPNDLSVPANENIRHTWKKYPARVKQSEEEGGSNRSYSSVDGDLEQEDWD